MKKLSGVIICILLFTGCVSTSSTVLDSAPEDRPSVDTSQVVVYSSTESIECDYDRVAFVEAEGSIGALSDEKMIRNAKEAAAGVDANTVIIESMDTSGIEEGGEGNQGQFLALYEKRPC